MDKSSFAAPWLIIKLYSYAIRSSSTKISSRFIFKRDEVSLFFFTRRNYSLGRVHIIASYYILRREAPYITYLAYLLLKRSVWLHI